jgi:hypothetical protein
MKKLITGGTGTLFLGPGWTPKFSKYTASPYDPEQDMENVDRQRAETGMEESDWKPKKAVHGSLRAQGIEMPAKTVAPKD